MAQYFLHIKSISRGRGARVTRAAAYRAGEHIRDERTRESYNFTHRRDVPYKEIMLPTSLREQPGLDWARDRSSLWNAAEHAGRRRDSRLAKEVMIALPAELTPDQRIAAARNFSRTLVDRYGSAADIAIHEPRPGSDERNHHAHILLTTREVTPQGLGQRTALELGGRERHKRGLGPEREEFEFIREKWAQVANEALRTAGLTVRIDHRSYRERGINREPVPSIPKKIYYLERKTGVRTRAGDAIRAEHHERVAARIKGPNELERVVRTQKEAARLRMMEKSDGPVREREAAEPSQQGGLSYRDRQSGAIKTANESAREWAKYRARHPEDVKTRMGSATSEDSARKWMEYRASHPEDIKTAEDSARRWAEYRARHPESIKTAEDSVREWLKYRANNSGDIKTAANSARDWAQYRALLLGDAKTTGDLARDYPSLSGGRRYGSAADKSRVQTRSERDRDRDRDREHDHDGGRGYSRERENERDNDKHTSRDLDYDAGL